MVRLKDKCPSPVFILTLFQFQYGTIKSETADLVKFAKIRFNSSMVRLKDLDDIIRDNWVIRFNSSMVRLKVKQAAPFYQGVKRFNSSMVRLKAVRRPEKIS